MPKQLTYDEIAELADVIVAHKIDSLAPFEMARVILQAGYERTDRGE